MVYAQVMFYVDFCDRGLCLALLMRAALTLNFLQIYGFVVFFVKGKKNHYTSFVLDRSSDKWFLCNDSVIKQTDLALCKNPYVLLYVLKSFDA